MKRNVPSELLCIRDNWFVNCCTPTCIIWKGVFSPFFDINFGVREGSVPSPLLFCVYINDIVNRMLSRQRCQVVLYADDILIIDPSTAFGKKNPCVRRVRWMEFDTYANAVEFRAHSASLTKRRRFNIATECALRMRAACVIRRFRFVSHIIDSVVASPGIYGKAALV